MTRFGEGVRIDGQGASGCIRARRPFGKNVGWRMAGPFQTLTSLPFTFPPILFDIIIDGVRGAGRMDRAIHSIHDDRSVANQ